MSSLLTCACWGPGQPMETRPRRRCGGHPIPLHEGQRIYYSETFRLYNNDDDEPIYFSGTDPRNASLGQPAGGCNLLVAARGGGARARRGAVI